MPLKSKPILPTAFADASGKTYTVPRLKIGSTAILYANGAQVATAVVDNSGKATWTLANAITVGTFVFYYCDGSLGGLSIAGPTLLTILGASGTAIIGDTTSFTPTISGGIPPYTVSATGLPPGRAIQSVSTGLTTGSYTTAGTYSSIVYTVIDSVGATATMTRTVTVAASQTLAGVSSGTSTVAGTLTAVVGAVKGLLGDGDSIIRGYLLSDPTTQCMLGQYASISGKPIFNSGSDGDTLANINTTWGSSGHAARYSATSLNAYLLEGGGADLRAGTTDATCRTNCQQIIAQAKAAGYICYVSTVLPQSLTKSAGWNSASDAQRVSYNTWLKSNWQSFADGIVDLAGVTEATDPDNTTYYPDGIHPTAALATILGQAIAKALSGSVAGLGGTSRGLSTATGTLSQSVTLSGTSSGVSSASGTLTVPSAGAGSPTVQWNAADKDPAVTKTSATRVDRASTAGSNYATIRSDTSRTSGVRYVEFKIEAITSNNGQGLLFGFATGSEVLSNYLGQTNKSVGLWTSGSTVIFNAGANNNTLGQPVAGDIIGCVLDFTAGTVKFNRNNSAFSPTTNVAAMIALGPIFVGASLVSGTPLPGATANFGDSAFAYTPPAGAVAWNVA